MAACSAARSSASEMVSASSVMCCNMRSARALIVVHRRETFRQSSAQPARRLCSSQPRQQCDPDSACSFRCHRGQAAARVPALPPDRSASPANETQRSANCSTPDRRDVAPHIHASCRQLSFAGTERVVARETRQLRILGPHIFLVEALAVGPPPQRAPLRRAQLHGLSSAPVAHASPRGVAQPVCLARIRAALSSGAASPPKTNPARKTGPDDRPQSFRDRQIYLPCPGGTPDISPCDESRSRVSVMPSAHGFFVRPLAFVVCAAEPRRGRPVAIFAGDAFRQSRTDARAAPAVVYSAWHARHFGDSSAFAPSFRMRAMRSPISPVSA